MEPAVEVSARIARSPEEVWAAFADPSRYARWSPEASGASSEGPLAQGARFTGSNRNRLMRWSTSCQVVESVPGSAFAFDVSYLGMAVSRWRYVATTDEDGCLVTEQWFDRRGPVMKVLGIVGTGVADRTEHNRQTMTETLAALKAELERAGG